VLAHYLAEASPPGAGFGPGARDATRLAASDATLWTEIFLMNRDQLLPALRALEEPLGQLERALEAGDAAALRSWLTRAADWRRRLDVGRCGARYGRLAERAAATARSCPRVLPGEGGGV